ncbi:hypothetical protein KC726_02910 [Candidatus Woesebacteria bacterium]|nr:hypothetical protein [Candidatus Woesebacteria bacterium]
MTTKNFTPINVEDVILGKGHAKNLATHSFGGKETEPRSIKHEGAEITPDIEFVDTEPKIEDKEVAEYVEIKKDTIELHPHLKKAGLQTVDASSLDTKHKIALPISDDKVVTGLHKPITSSYRWLAELCLFLLHQAHLTLKTIHGKVVRILQR